MQFIDLAAQQQRIHTEIEANIRAVLGHGKYIMGPEVAELEQKLAAYVGMKHAVACSSGTDALLLALMGFGVGPGDAIFTTPFTFISTAEVIALLGATPVFVDIDPDTFNLEPGDLEKAIDAVKSGDSSMYPMPFQDSSDTSRRQPLRPKGIIAVDLFGLPADYDRINSIGRRHGLFVVEDAAQSFGAEYKGQMACSLSEIACTSFFPAKPLGGYGDGGMCFTADDNLVEMMRSLRIHGKGGDKYDNARIGINGRLDTLQAAILLAKFDIFPEEIALRQEVAGRYTELLGSFGPVSTPSIPPEMKSAWAQYSLLAENEEHRSAIQGKLKDEGIPTAVYYPRPLHLQTAFTYLGYREGDFPVSESMSRRIFSLPMHPYLNLKDQERIAQFVREGNADDNG